MSCEQYPAADEQSVWPGDHGNPYRDGGNPSPEGSGPLPPVPDVESDQGDADESGEREGKLLVQNAAWSHQARCLRGGVDELAGLPAAARQQSWSGGHDGAMGHSGVASGCPALALSRPIKHCDSSSLPLPGGGWISNQRRRAPTDLQSVPFSHSGTPPRWQSGALWPNQGHCQRSDRSLAHHAYAGQSQWRRVDFPRPNQEIARCCHRNVRCSISRTTSATSTQPRSDHCRAR